MKKSGWLVFMIVSACLGFTSGAWAFNANHGQVNVAGSFNGWDSETANMTLVADHIWRADLTIPDSDFEFKFATPGFGASWGRNAQPHATLPMAEMGDWDGGNIAVSNPGDNNLIRFMLNDQTGRYVVFLINNLGTNLLYNSSFEVAGSSGVRARYWQLNQPNLHGDFSGAARRSQVTPPAMFDGNWAAIIPGAGLGLGNEGAWWQEAPVEPGLTYEASAYYQVLDGWTAAFAELKMEFFDFNGGKLSEEVAIPLTGLDTNWQLRTVSAQAPANAVFGRFVTYAVGVDNPGTFRMDVASIEAVSARREEDFNAWVGTGVDGNYTVGGWSMFTGKTVSIVVDGPFTNNLARSGLAASLANDTANTNGGGYVRSPALDVGIGAISFYYRHGHTGDPEEEPTDPVRLRVQTSFGGEVWTTVGEIDDIVNVGYQRAEIFQEDYSRRYVRIVHAGGSTNRVIIDDIAIGLPEAAPRLMTFDNWPDATAPGCHAFSSWQICTGLVTTVAGREGLSAQIMGATGDPNYLRSPFFVDGYGGITFEYRRGTNGANAVGFAVEASTNEVDWITLDTVMDIATPTWQNYSHFFYDETPHFIRIRNLLQTTPPAGGAVLIDEPFDTGTSPPPVGWSLTSISQYTTDASSGESPRSLQFNSSSSVALTPTFTNPTNLTFWLKGNGTGSSASTFHVEALQGSTWVPVANINPLPTVAAGQTFSYALATNTTRLRFSYTKDDGNAAFDDVLVTGLPPPPEATPQWLELDNVRVREPAEFRTQNFDSWPTKGSYVTGAAEHQFWTLVNDVIVDSQNAFAGQVARLRRPAGGPDPYVQSHFFRDGVGTIDFVYRAWPNDLNVGFRVQASSNAVDWITLDTVTNVSNTEYTPFNIFVNSNDLHYVRIVQHAGNDDARLLVDEISIPAPSPAPNVILSGTHEPDRPYTNDLVTLRAQAIPQFGAIDITVTSYYRVGSSGPFLILDTPPVGGQVFESESIAAQSPGTTVEYYFEAYFNGPGGQSGMVTFPADGAADPLWYGIPRNPPGSVWINEIDYIDNWANGMFIELAGRADSDISDWRIEILDLNQRPYVLRGHYPIASDTVLSDTVDGFGFFVLGGEDIPEPPLDMLLTNFLDFGIGGVLLYNEMDQIEHAVSYEGLGEGFDRILAVDAEDFMSFAPSTNSVVLVGTGAESSDFSWSDSAADGGPTPGAANPGQTFGDPPLIAFAPASLAFQYVRNSSAPLPQSIMITNAGGAALNYTLAPSSSWLSVSPVSGSLAPGATLSHTVSVNTSNLIGNYNAILQVIAPAGNSPQEIPVALQQIPLQNSLLAYAMDQGAGMSVFNGGSLGPDGNLTRSAEAGWTLSGGGASGAGGDYALVFTNETAHAASAAPLTELDEVESMTLTGWLRTSGTDAGPFRIVGNRDGSAGFDLMISSNYQALALVSSSAGAPAPVHSDPHAWNNNEWQFFAVTFDANDTGSEAIRFYRGDIDAPVVTLSTHSLSALGQTGLSTNALHIGGDGVNAAFGGTLDDVRVYTSVLSAMEIEGIRQLTESRQTEGLSAPVITQQPQSQTRNLNQAVEFAVVATGNPIPVYQWRFNGEPIPNATLSTYFITQSEESDSGHYDVVVMNTQGSVTSQVAVLTITAPPIFTVHPEAVAAITNQPFTLNSIAIGDPPPQYQWYLDGTPIPGATASNFVVSAATLDDAGTYYVVASNSLGAVQSDNAVVEVGSRFWQPDDVEAPMALWMDASDASTLWADFAGTVPATGNVLRWDDKSTNAWQALRGGSLSPQLQSDPRPSVRGTGTRYFAITNGQVFAGASAGTVMVVGRQGGNNGGWGRFSNNSDGVETPRNNGVLYENFLSNERRLSPSVDGLAGTPGPLAMIEFHQTGSMLVMRVNAEDVHSQAATFAVPDATAASQRLFGQTQVYDLSEVVMYKGVLSSADRQRLEGYLAHKWDHADELPEGHPYRNTAPVVIDEGPPPVVDPPVFTPGSGPFGPTPDGFILRWESEPSAVYHIYWTDDLVAGFDIPLATDLPATPPENVHTDTLFNTESRRFYQLRIAE